MVTPLTIAHFMVEPDVSPNVGFFFNFDDGDTMARIEKKVLSKPVSPIGALPFTKLNYQILGAGIFFLILGYIALAQDPWDGTMPLVVAPILLVLGYCVLIPLGILFRKQVNKENNISSSGTR
jgi:hypothetical protein